jgi:hypothetical protein
MHFALRKSRRLYEVTINKLALINVDVTAAGKCDNQAAVAGRLQS